MLTPLSVAAASGAAYARATRRGDGPYSFSNTEGSRFPKILSKIVGSAVAVVTVWVCWSPPPRGALLCRPDRISAKCAGDGDVWSASACSWGPTGASCMIGIGAGKAANFTGSYHWGAAAAAVSDGDPWPT